MQQHQAENFQSYAAYVEKKTTHNSLQFLLTLLVCYQHHIGQPLANEAGAPNASFIPSIFFR